jgi:YfiH family protein
MNREERSGVVVYRFESLPEGVEALVSTRLGGVSAPPYESLNLGLRVGDDPEKVVENRRLLFQAFGMSLERSVWCKQIHADGVAVVSADDAGRGSIEETSIVEDADALVTDVPGLSLCVTLADCVPVVIFDPERSVVGLAHAGWGGTVSRISSRTVEVMRERFRCDPATMVAAIGPSIGPAGYEVGEDVIERATTGYGERASEILMLGPDGKKLFDLWTANRIDLEAAGVSGERIEVSGIATHEHLDTFYSHRHESGETGRFITAVTLRP